MAKKTTAEQKLHDRLTPKGVYDLHNGNALVGPIAKPDAHVQTLGPDEVRVIDDLKLGQRFNRDMLDEALSADYKKRIDGLIESLGD